MATPCHAPAGMRTPARPRTVAHPQHRWNTRSGLPSDSDLTWTISHAVSASASGGSRVGEGVSGAGGHLHPHFPAGPATGRTERRRRLTPAGPEPARPVRLRLPTLPFSHPLWVLHGEGMRLASSRQIKQLCPAGVAQWLRENPAPKSWVRSQSGTCRSSQLTLPLSPSTSSLSEIKTFLKKSFYLDGRRKRG